MSRFRYGSFSSSSHFVAASNGRPRVNQGPPQAGDYRAANWDSTSLHAGESWAALVARHCTIRPPPGWTPPQIVRTSAPQAERSTNSSSRGRIGRSTITTGAAGGATAPGPAGAATAAGALPAVGAAPPPVAAVTAFSQADESLALFLSRHSNAGAPPVG